MQASVMFQAPYRLTGKLFPMTRKHKNYLIWLIMGIHVGGLIADVTSATEPIGTWKWVLLAASLWVLILHYLPDRQEVEG